jgi:putative spermidine/putrescine transport system permease protein
MILRVFNWLLAAIMLAPLALIVWMSFTPAAFFRLPINNFSLRWYHEAFNYPGFLNSFVLSLKLAVVSGFIATALSFFAAYGLVRYRFRGKGLLEALFMSPILVPGVVFGIAMLQFVNSVGLYNTFWALVLAHVSLIVPYALRTIHAQLRNVPEDVEWAAQTLGAGKLKTLWRVTLPLCRRGVLAGFLLAFIISFAEVTVVIFMTGPAYQTLPIRIYNYLTDQIDPTVAAISAMLIGLSLILVFILDRLGGLRTISK